MVSVDSGSERTCSHAVSLDDTAASCAITKFEDMQEDKIRSAEIYRSRGE